MQFLIDHYDEILALLGTLYALVSGIVALTPSKEDDAFMVRVAQRLSFLAPRNSPRRFSLPGFMPGKAEDSIGPMIAVLLCLVPLSGCAHRQAIKAFVRGASCATCDALGGEAGCDAEGEE